MMCGKNEELKVQHTFPRIELVHGESWMERLKLHDIAQKYGCTSTFALATYCRLYHY